MRKDRGNLERADKAAARHRGWRLGRDVAAVVENLPGARVEKLGQQVEDGGLAGAVRPDQRVDRAAPDFEVDSLDGGKAAELFAQSAGLENQVGQCTAAF